MFEKKAHRDDSVMACLREGPICACDCIGECRCNTAFDRYDEVMATGAETDTAAEGMTYNR